jgi:PAS domain S-box-containing protein
MGNKRSYEQLLRENEELQSRLSEMEETLRAIRNNEIDALIIEGPEGVQAYTLHGAEEPYRVFVEAMSEGAVTLTQEGTILYCNKRFAEMLEAPQARIIGSSFQDLLIVPEQKDLICRLLNHRSEESLKDDFILGCPDGRAVEVHLSMRAFRWEDMEGFVVVATDLTARKQAEAALRESEERYRAAIEGAIDGVALMKGEHHAYVNRRFAEIFGFESPGEIIGKPLSATVHPDYLEMVVQTNRMRQQGESVPSRYEFKGLRKDGTETFVEVSATRTFYGGEPASLVYARDVSDRKKMEEQLRMAHKMEAIGTLAGGIAHDFNNILAGIIGFTEMALEDIPSGSLLERNLSRVLQGSYRGRDLVKQILTFSRKSGQTRKPVALSAAIEEGLKFLRASIPVTIEIVHEFRAREDTVLSDPTEIHQILVNLCTNAAHAMGETGGTLEITLTNVDFKTDNPAFGADIEPGQYAQLVVRDTGVGMEPTVMKRIFEPFFTTKQAGQGTGMGLSVVYGIVQALHGSITVESEPGLGTTFRVMLPVISATLESDRVVSLDDQGGNEHILFVDDEELLRESSRGMLERLGYKVTVAQDGHEALKLVSKDPAQFDLVITDQAMPGITGAALAKKLMKLRPDVPVILCTGHSDTVSSESARAAGIREFVMKPFSRREIGTLIRRVLNGKN